MIINNKFSLIAIFILIIILLFTQATISMTQNKLKKSVFSRIRNYFLTGAVVLIPIAITVYLTLFLIRISLK